MTSLLAQRYQLSEEVKLTLEMKDKKEEFSSSVVAVGIRFQVVVVGSFEMEQGILTSTHCTVT